MAFSSHVGGFVVATHWFRQPPVVDVPGGRRLMALRLPGWCCTWTCAGASILHPHWIVELLTHLATILSPVPPLLLATALLQLPVLVVGMVPVMVGSGASFTASLEFSCVDTLLLRALVQPLKSVPSLAVTGKVRCQA